MAFEISEISNSIDAFASSVKCYIVLFFIFLFLELFMIEALLLEFLHDLGESIVEEGLIFIVGIEDDLGHILIEIDEVLMVDDEGVGEGIF